MKREVDETHSSRSPPGARGIPRREKGRSEGSAAEASPGAQTKVCAIGTDPAATLSAPSEASILATVGVQDGLLASLRLARNNG